MVPQALYSLEDVAVRLGLTVRTVRAYVRTGRLKATKIGKQYRVGRDSLEALTGNTDAFRRTDAALGQRRVTISSVIDVNVAPPELAGRLSNLLIAAAGGNRGHDSPLRVETIHDPARASLKIVVIGDLSASAEVFKLVQAVLER